MMTFLLNLICAVALVPGPVPAPVDTTSVYVVNGQTIPNFDGSQLLGSSIKSYRIVIENQAGKPVKRHIITTEKVVIKTADASIEDFPVGSVTIVDSDHIDNIPLHKGEIIEKTSQRTANVFGPENVIYILDGKRITEKEVKKLDVSKIASISVRNDPGVAKKYRTKITTIAYIVTKK